MAVSVVVGLALAPTVHLPLLHLWYFCVCHDVEPIFHVLFCKAVGAESDVAYGWYQTVGLAVGSATCPEQRETATR